MTYVWKIWFPQHRKVKLIRDAVFDDITSILAGFPTLAADSNAIEKEPQELDQAQAERAF